ncbi:hypothetical protein GCM10025778_02630 [Paeniglutamicibacter antarcticus]|uniref:Uncharacterized protein n=1 Tax=Paeniglutamicibacter antarcticus TaxID=494023 RepID=A0ABP9TIS6_9MICC
MRTGRKDMKRELQIEGPHDLDVGRGPQRGTGHQSPEGTGVGVVAAVVGRAGFSCQWLVAQWGAPFVCSCPQAAAAAKDRFVIRTTREAWGWCASRVGALGWYASREAVFILAKPVRRFRLKA